MKTGQPTVLFIVGSLRKESLNRQLALAAQEIIKEQAQVERLEYSDIPYMNQDIEFPSPDSVTKARDAVRDADAIWIFSPEYNHSIPGVLKNLIDWLSRPLSPDYKIPSVIKGKIVTYSGAAGSSAARYMMSDLNKVLHIIGCDVLEEIIASISLNREEYTTSKLTLSEDERAALATQAKALLDRIS